MNILPDGASYSTVVNACERSAQWQEALSVFDAIQEGTGHHPDLNSYGAAIASLEKAGQWERALNLFGRMHLVRITPDAVVCRAAISACQTGAQWQQALRWLEASAIDAT